MKDRKNIFLPKTLSRYGSVDNYIDKIAEAMRKLGCNTCVLDVWSMASPMRYNYVLANYKFDAVIDINCMLNHYGAPGNLPEDVIYGSYLCDPPKPLDNRLRAADGRTVIFSCDNDFRSYIKRFYPNIKDSEFMPLSGTAYPECVPYKDRKIDVLFTGSYEDPEQVKKRLHARIVNGDMQAEFCEDLLEDILLHEDHTLEDCLSVVLEKHNQYVSREEFDELMGKYMDVHWYARSYFREQMICALLEEGIEIHVYGNGWKEFCFPHKEKLVIHEGGPYAARKALANARIALNIMPWFKDGFQERIASAMLSRSVAVTDGSRYIYTNFEDGKDLILFSLKDFKSLAERIRYLLRHPDEAEEIAENGYRKVQHHTWHSRTRDMLQRIEEDFGDSFIQDGEGKQLEFEVGYPNQRLILLDAIYELKKMSDFIVDDMGKIEKLSSVDMECLIDRFRCFQLQFAEYLGEMEMNRQIWTYMHSKSGEIPKHVIELFSIQCRAWMGRLLKNVRELDFARVA